MTRRFDRSTQRSLLALLVVLALLSSTLLAACGGDDDAGDADLTPTAGNATATPPAATATATVPTPTATTAASPTAGSPQPTATSTTASEATPTTAQPSPTPTGETITLAVYFLRGETIGTAHRRVPATRQVAAAAMQELLAGPNQLEMDAGLTSAVPEGVEYLGTTIDNGVATVNLSGAFDDGGGSLSMQARLAQVVYTLTQFPTVGGVLLQLDGQPVKELGGEGIVIDHPLTRADFEELTPLIFVESPAVGDTISSPVRVYGTANTFEAVFEARILDADGNVIGEAHVMATSGTGTRGTYDVTIEFDNPGGGPVVLKVFEYSAKDGSEVHIVEIPLAYAAP